MSQGPARVVVVRSLAGDSEPTTDRSSPRGSADIRGAVDVDSALTVLRDAVGVVAAADLSPVDADQAVAMLRGLECETRRLASVRASLLCSIERQGLHQIDGHANVRTMARHVGRVSNATASAQVRSMEVLRHLPELARRFSIGEVGIDQVNLLGRLYSNPRVAPAMADRDDWFCRCAMTLSYRDFEAVVRRWERLADEDGPEPANSRTHERRNARLSQNAIDLSWELLGSYAAMQGAAMNEIFGRYVEAELSADWEKARAEFGDMASYSDLVRTPAQRRADALWQIFQDAAACEPGAIPPGFLHNIVWDAETFENMVAQLDESVDGEDHPPSTDPETMRCETIDGIELEPVEAMVNATVSAVRRVVVDAKGVTIDLGQARLFTGNARHAVRLSDSCCVWPGCEVPASRCEIDHLREHARGGRTNPENGAVMCGKHNRWKQGGYAVHRDQAGNWHTYRPSGEEIP